MFWLFCLPLLCCLPLAVILLPCIMPAMRHWIYSHLVLTEIRRSSHTFAVEVATGPPLSTANTFLAEMRSAEWHQAPWYRSYFAAVVCSKGFMCIIIVLEPKIALHMKIRYILLCEISFSTERQNTQQSQKESIFPARTDSALHVECPQLKSQSMQHHHFIQVWIIIFLSLLEYQ